MMPTRKSSTWLSAAISLLLLGGACKQDPPGLDIELVPDPNLSTEDQIVERVETVVMVVDGPGGLYDSALISEDDRVSIEDVDSDGELELVATIAVHEHLPTIRLLHGGLPDVPLDIRVLGAPRGGVGSTVAAGRVQGVSLHDASLAIPFNIRREHLPPRVAEVVPGDGVPAQGCEVGQTLVLFSKPVDPATVVGAISFEPGGAPVSIAIDEMGLIAQVTPPVIYGDGRTLTYRLIVSTDVMDMNGVRLDQVGSAEGDQPYAEELTRPCSPPVSAPIPICGMGTGPLDPSCPGFPRFTCVEGSCLPANCEGAECVAGHVCDPFVGSCVPDCRQWAPEDACPPDRSSCDPESGGCR